MISVIMPVYNNFSYLKESIESILNQTYEDFEFIILDDASTEPVWDILRLYKDKRIIKLKNKNNIGLTKSLNICLDRAKGDFIARQDGDDISFKTRFEEEMKLFNDNIGLVSSYAYRFNKSGKIADPWLNNDVRLSDKKIQKRITQANCIVGPAAIYPKKVVNKIGYYDENVYLAQDYNYWIRILNFFDVKICRKVLYALRSHNKSVRTIKSKVDKTDWVEISKRRAISNPIIKEKE